MSLRLERGDPFGPTPLAADVSCGTAAETQVPKPGLDLSTVSIHVGLEGSGRVRYHEIAIWQPDPG